MAEPHAPEDFPSLLPKRLIAPDLHAGLDAMVDFMAKTRAIADDAKTPPHLKDAQLVALEGALTTQEGYVPLPRGVSPTIMSPGFTLRRESDERRIPVIYGRRIAQAYKQDALKKGGYRDWSDLLNYLRYAAGASSQYALECLRVDKSLAPAFEALGLANALLARMESFGDDFTRKRVYLPQRWLQDAGLDVEELTLESASAPKWLKVRDEGVTHARKLLTQGAPAIKAIRFATASGGTAPAPKGAATTRGSTADGFLAGPGTVEGRGHSGADLSAGTGPCAGSAADRWKLKLALAWVKAALDARCDALAASPTFPAAPAAPPSMTRLAFAAARNLF